MTVTLQDILTLLGASFQQLELRWRETAQKLGLDRPPDAAIPGGGAGSDNSTGGSAAASGQGPGVGLSPGAFAARLFASPEAAEQAGQTMRVLLERMDGFAHDAQSMLTAIGHALSGPDGSSDGSSGSPGGSSGGSSGGQSFSPPSPFQGGASSGSGAAAGDSAGPGPYPPPDASRSAHGPAGAAGNLPGGMTSGATGDAPPATAAANGGVSFASGSSGSLAAASPAFPRGAGRSAALFPGLPDAAAAAISGLTEALSLLHAAADAMDTLYSPGRTPGLTGEIPGAGAASRPTGNHGGNDSAATGSAAGLADAGPGAPLAGPEFIPPPPQGGAAPAAPAMNITCRGLSVRAPSAGMQNTQRPMRDINYELGRLVDNANKGVR